MEKEPFKRLGQILIEHTIITSDQLHEALREQEKSGKLLGRVLVDTGILAEEELLRILGIQIGIPTVNLKNITIDEATTALLMPSLVKIYNIIPIFHDEKSVTVAMEDPLDINAIDDIRFMLNRQVKVVIASADDIREAVEKYYGQSDESVNDLLGELFSQMPGEALELKKDINTITLQELAGQEPVVRLVNVVLLQAVKDKASDIHFEPFEKEYRIRYRIDGTLSDIAYPPHDLHLAVCSRVKVISNLDIAERRLPQDGRIMMRIEGKIIDIRVSTLPTIFGESIVMRILDRSIVNLSIEDVGLVEEDRKKILQVIKKPNGIILNTGPTGSGKTTSLYSFLRQLNTSESKIITTEDPVEYDIDGIIQVPIRPKINLGFAQCLRHILRHDPDIIMLGEIRDAESANIAIQASLTGHLVLSTVHTNDAPSTIARLFDMGIEPFLITATIEAVMAQRLMRLLCKHCRKKHTPNAKTLVEKGLPGKLLEGGKHFYISVGCAKCNQSGFSGRLGIFEIMLLNDEIKTLIMDRSPTSKIRQAARKSGMKTLREDGLEKALKGLIAFDEIISASE